MSQGFDVTLPATGVTTFGELYAALRANFQALQTNNSGSSALGSPVVGQTFYDTDTNILYIYTAGGWKEIPNAGYGMGDEIVEARGSHSTLDNRLDVLMNEDGTSKASPDLNPSQWYDLTQASGYVSTTSFKVYDSDSTTIHYATRRLKVNRAAGTYYTEVVSSAYSDPDTTVVTKDAVVSTDLEYVSHSIVSPRKASSGDGAVSYEMIANKNTVTKASSTTATLNDSVIFLNGVYTTTLPSAVTFGAGRMLFLINIHASATHTVAGGGGQTINGGASVSVLAGQSLIIVSDGSNWYRLDQPNQIAVESWTTVTSGFGTNWAGTISYMKDSFGFVHLKGQLVAAGSGAAVAYQIPEGYRPDSDSNFLTSTFSGSEALPTEIETDGEIRPSYTTSTICYLDGITFKVA